jgi:hypothetical protein
MIATAWMMRFTFLPLVPFDEHTQRRLCAADLGVILIFLNAVSNPATEP